MHRAQVPGSFRSFYICTQYVHMHICVQVVYKYRQNALTTHVPYVGSVVSFAYTNHGTKFQIRQQTGTKTSRIHEWIHGRRSRRYSMRIFHIFRERVNLMHICRDKQQTKTKTKTPEHLTGTLCFNDNESQVPRRNGTQRDHRVFCSLVDSSVPARHLPVGATVCHM